MTIFTPDRFIAKYNRTYQAWGFDADTCCECPERKEMCDSCVVERQRLRIGGRSEHYLRLFDASMVFSRKEAFRKGVLMVAGEREAE